MRPSRIHMQHPYKSVGVGLPHYQFVKTARDATWRLVTVDPKHFLEGTPFLPNPKQICSVEQYFLRWSLISA
jgi:hypothetical protein